MAPLHSLTSAQQTQKARNEQRHVISCSNKGLYTTSLEVNTQGSIIAWFNEEKLFCVNLIRNKKIISLTKAWIYSRFSIEVVRFVIIGKISEKALYTLKYGNFQAEMIVSSVQHMHPLVYITKWQISIVSGEQSPENTEESTILLWYTLERGESNSKSNKKSDSLDDAGKGRGRGEVFPKKQKPSQCQESREIRVNMWTLPECKISWMSEGTHLHMSTTDCGDHLIAVKLNHYLIQTYLNLQTVLSSVPNKTHVKRQSNRRDSIQDRTRQYTDERTRHTMLVTWAKEKGVETDLWC